MTQKQSPTFLGRHTTLANRDGHYKGYNRNKAVSKFTNTKTGTTTQKALQKANQDINILLNVTDVLTQHHRYHQIYTYAHIIFAYLRDCLTYTMDYVDAATTNILSTDILLLKELKGMLRHIESQLLSIMHLPYHQITHSISTDI